MENRERLIKEQTELKEKYLKLTEFINSEKFYELSENNKLLLKNQKIAMELYLSTLNMRVFENIDKITVPDLGMIQLIGGVFGNTWNKPLTMVSNATAVGDNNAKPEREANMLHT